jgi:ABC-type Na+ efflux pump permease subunit
MKMITAGFLLVSLTLLIFGGTAILTESVQQADDNTGITPTDNTSSDYMNATEDAQEGIYSLYSIMPFLLLILLVLAIFVFFNYLL